MPSDEHDLEGYWSDFHTSTLLQPRGSEGGLELAAAKARFDTTLKYQDEPDAAKVAQIANSAIDAFRQHWQEELLCRGPGGIVDLILMDQGLTIPELKIFLRALPESLIKRIVNSGATGSSAKGIHALLAIEYHYRINRQQFTRDYALTRDAETLVVTAYPVRTPEPLQFRLDDTFDLSDMPK
jgi:hypothetical protein